MSRRAPIQILVATAAWFAILQALPARAASDRLLATGGVMQLEGAAGGGLTPWALIAGLGTDHQVGGSAFCTRVSPQDFRLDSCGAAIGIHDRVEVSYATQKFDLGTTVPDHSIRQHVIGLKVRLVGDAVYDQDRWLPQIAVGLQHKKNDDYALVPHLIGARDDSDTDFYLAATKLFLGGVFGHNALLDVTLRATRANQMGILGFGGDLNNTRRLEPEGSAAVFLTDHLVLGVEYRAKPNNLSAFREDDFKDVFAAWLPCKFVSLTMAYAALGNIADKPNQNGLYGSLQASF